MQKKRKVIFSFFDVEFCLMVCETGREEQGQGHRDCGEAVCIIHHPWKWHKYLLLLQLKAMDELTDITCNMLIIWYGEDSKTKLPLKFSYYDSSLGHLIAPTIGKETNHSSLSSPFTIYFLTQQSRLQAPIKTIAVPYFSVLALANSFEP